MPPSRARPPKGCARNDFPHNRTLRLTFCVSYGLVQGGDAVGDPADDLKVYFIGYAVPTLPGKCRIFTRYVRGGAARMMVLLYNFHD